MAEAPLVVDGCAPNVHYIPLCLAKTSPSDAFRLGALLPSSPSFHGELPLHEAKRIRFNDHDTVFPITFDYQTFLSFPCEFDAIKVRGVLCLWWDDANQFGGMPSFVVCTRKDYEVESHITITLRRKFGNLALSYRTVQVNSAERDFILGVCLEEDDALTTPDDQADEASEALPLMERPTRKKRAKRKSEEDVLREIAQGNEEDQAAPCVGSTKRPRNPIPNLIGREVQWKQERFYGQWPSWLSRQTDEFRNTIIHGRVVSQVNEGIPKCTIEFDDPSAPAQENRHTLPLSNLLAELGE